MPHEPDSDSTVVEASASAGWTAWPAAERPLRTVILLIFIAALSVLAGMIGGDVLWGATGAALLLATLNRWFLPTSYRFDEDLFEAGFPLRRRSIGWKNVRRVVIDPQGDGSPDGGSNRGCGPARGSICTGDANRIGRWTC